MREQKGYVFHKGKSWFVRYCDDVLQPDGTIKRKLICKKMEVDYGGDYKTKKSVRPFSSKILSPLNAGLLNPQSTMTVSDFVDKTYLPEHVTKQLRAATLHQYSMVWENHLKPRMGEVTLRDFRTVHAEKMLAKIAEQTNLGRSSLRHCKAFLSGVFKTAKRLGILDGVNPIQDVSIPQAPEPPDTYAYSLPEIKGILARLNEPARTVVLTAAFTGLRKSELLGLRWQDFNGKELTVQRSFWNGIEGQPKTRRSRAPVPVVKELGDARETHRLRAGILAQPDLPIFRAGNGNPLNLDNLARRTIAPAIERCTKCRKPAGDHKPEGHPFELDKNLEWHGWHSFRRGLATNLHDMGADDKTIQAILRHSNVRLTQDVYIKTVNQSQVNAMDAMSKKLETCNDLATNPAERVQ